MVPYICAMYHSITAIYTHLLTCTYTPPLPRPLSPNTHILTCTYTTPLPRPSSPYTHILTCTYTPPSHAHHHRTPISSSALTPHLSHAYPHLIPISSSARTPQLSHAHYHRTPISSPARTPHLPRPWPAQLRLPTGPRGVGLEGPQCEEQCHQPLQQRCLQQIATHMCLTSACMSDFAVTLHARTHAANAIFDRFYRMACYAANASTLS